MLKQAAVSIQQQEDPANVVFQDYLRKCDMS
jgi:hypothetical protein